ncbi:Crp/Fnr family transcriptional regulator [Bradyrhizobium liaoningense]|uniref:Crp/Fnr family transcriptional regulator n=1 Tax=Bradyrhizobium liaoningense TaxID=43992 RepID=UPI001BABD984|nr:Crp/Fnr family transcriptional regulator [Bradyrhizobium liaoningense]MBR0842118.1 Crp/Fnr family transcriptional regulator [Bradyrhizobium liaoningense]
MIPRRRPFVQDVSPKPYSPTPLRLSTVNTSLDESESATFVDNICSHGDCLHLRQQQRVPLPPPGKVVLLREGMLAIDAMPAKGKLQVLDFLVAGDVLSAATVLPTPGVSLRAITCASLVCLDPPSVNQVVPSHDYWAFLLMRCHNQLARANIHQLLVGRLETEQRVASFILDLALRKRRKDSRSVSVELPMSRTDIANYLVINCDTLSRTMMRFCESGLIERESRHAIRVLDVDALKKKSPLASLLSAMFEKRAGREEFGCERHAEAGMPAPDEERGVAPLVLTVGGLARPAASYPHSSRGL